MKIYFSFKDVGGGCVYLLSVAAALKFSLPRRRRLYFL
jgi:hypothetical protein